MVTLGAATGALSLVVAYILIMRGEFTATLNDWQDSRFAIEAARYQLSFALVGAWTGLRRQPGIPRSRVRADPLRG